MLNKIMIYMLFLSLLFSNLVFSQKIMRRIKQYVLIDVDSQSDFKIDDQLDVYRNSDKNKEIIIGKIKLVKFQEDKWAGQIIREDNNYSISPGDYIKPSFTANDNLFNLYNKEEPKKYNTTVYPKKSNNLPRYIVMGSGLLICGLGYSYHNKANSIYDDYKSASTPENASKYYNETVKYDKRTNISLGVGAGLIILGIVYPIFKSNTPSTIQSSFNIESDYNKITFTFNFPLIKSIFK